jgi:Fic family protein
MCIYDQKDWPKLTWDDARLSPLLADARLLQGRLLGRMEEIGFQLREEATLGALTEDVIKTSEIEGEKLDGEQVRSSLAKKMGVDAGALAHGDRNVDGIVEVVLDATRNFDAPLTKERLFAWHSSLFPAPPSAGGKISVGKRRTDATGPMQVVSGLHGRQKIHFEAPPHDRLERETGQFLEYFNSTPESDLVLRSAVAHFWFVTIHPFDDGNGRIARAIADLTLARSENNPQRFYSMSSQIRRERKAYYDILERSQKGSLNITPWIEWYLQCLRRAIGGSQELLEAILRKSRFWRAHAGEPFSERQQTLVNRLLDGFEGKLTSSKWARLAKCSQDTALRDIDALLGRGILAKENAGGRSTSYRLCLP